MTNLMYTCFILKYVHYNPLHVSSLSCSLSGSWPLTERTIPDVASIQFNLLMGKVERELCIGWPLTGRTIPDAASV